MGKKVGEWEIWAVNYWAECRWLDVWRSQVPGREYEVEPPWCGRRRVTIYEPAQ